MKYKTIPYFSIILILLIPANAFGDLDLVLLQEDLFGIRAPVNISVDLPIFTDADKIVIYGNVPTEAILQVMIIDPDEKIILNKDITIQAGDFTYDIVIGDYDLGRSGHYYISVSYNESEITKQFFYDSGHNVNPMKVDGTIESLTESEQMIVFAIAATIIISVLIFLARVQYSEKKMNMILVSGNQKRIEIMKNITPSGRVMKLVLNVKEKTNLVMKILENHY